MSNLIQVSPFHDDPLKDGYRTCDFCYQSALDDPDFPTKCDDEWRKFYISPDECGLCVCEKCLPDYEKETEPMTTNGQPDTDVEWLRKHSHLLENQPEVNGHSCKAEAVKLWNIAARLERLLAERAKQKEAAVKSF